MVALPPTPAASPAAQAQGGSPAHPLAPPRHRRLVPSPRRLALWCPVPCARTASSCFPFGSEIRLM
eukprot:13833469-Alexandrium_andersonii.AAC.1